MISKFSKYIGDPILVKVYTWKKVAGNSNGMLNHNPTASTPAIDKILTIKNAKAWVSMISYLKNE